MLQAVDNKYPGNTQGTRGGFVNTLLLVRHSPQVQAPNIDLMFVGGNCTSAQHIRLFLLAIDNDFLWLHNAWIPAVLRAVQGPPTDPAAATSSSKSRLAGANSDQSLSALLWNMQVAIDACLMPDSPVALRDTVAGKRPCDSGFLLFPDFPAQS